MEIKLKISFQFEMNLYENQEPIDAFEGYESRAIPQQQEQLFVD